MGPYQDFVCQTSAMCKGTAPKALSSVDRAGMELGLHLVAAATRDQTPATPRRRMRPRPRAAAPAPQRRAAPGPPGRPCW